MLLKPDPLEQLFRRVQDGLYRRPDTCKPMELLDVEILKLSQPLTPKPQGGNNLKGLGFRIRVFRV